MTFLRLYRLHRNGGRSRRVALRLSWRSIHLDWRIERARRACLARQSLPFTTSRPGDL